MKNLISKELIMYGIIGVLTTILNIVVTYLLYNICKLNENLVVLLSWIIVIIAAYILNAIFVFESKFNTIKEESVKISKFVLTRIFTYIIEAAGVYIFITKLHYHFWLIKSILLILVVILNYILAKFILFIKQEKKINVNNK